MTEHPFRCTLASRLVLCAALSFAPLLAHAQGDGGAGFCGPITSSYGPFDYRTNKKELEIVEKFHFGPEVETLQRGMSGPLGADLNYTLTTYPNHLRALHAMARLGDKLKTQQPHGAKYTVECYFDRAIRFRGDDTGVLMLYANFLWRANRGPEALKRLARAVELAKDNPFTHYNAGLMYAEFKEWDLALVQAHRAMAMGMARVDLKNALVAAGKWVEPTAQEPAPATTAGPTAAAASATTR